MSAWREAGDGWSLDGADGFSAWVEHFTDADQTACYLWSVADSSGDCYADGEAETLGGAQAEAEAVLAECAS